MQVFFFFCVLCVRACICVLLLCELKAWKKKLKTPFVCKLILFAVLKNPQRGEFKSLPPPRPPNLENLNRSLQCVWTQRIIFTIYFLNQQNPNNWNLLKNKKAAIDGSSPIRLYMYGEFLLYILYICLSARICNDLWYCFFFSFIHFCIPPTRAPSSGSGFFFLMAFSNGKCIIKHHSVAFPSRRAWWWFFCLHLFFFKCKVFSKKNNHNNNNNNKLATPPSWPNSWSLLVLVRVDGMLLEVLCLNCIAVLMVLIIPVRSTSTRRTLVIFFFFFSRIPKGFFYISVFLLGTLY